MRSVEDMGYVLYLVDWRDIRVEPPNGTWPPKPAQWDELTEEEQSNYVRYASATMEHLFEHGRISSYIDHAMLDELSAEYQAYLTSQEEQKPLRDANTKAGEG